MLTIISYEAMQIIIRSRYFEQIGHLYLTQRYRRLFDAFSHCMDCLTAGNSSGHKEQDDLNPSNK
jgi:hypothetical protein